MASYFQWRYNNNGTIFTDVFNIPYNMNDLDVCILLRPNNWFVLIAYKDVSIPKLLAYKFNPINKTFTFVSNTTLGNGNGIYTDIQIDSDQSEHFFVVWDQPNNTGVIKIFGASGGIANNSISICMTNYEFPLFNDPISGSTVNPPYYFPDVAVMELPIPSVVDIQMQARITFVGTSCSAYPNSSGIVCIPNDFKSTDWINCTYSNLSNTLAYIKPPPSGTLYMNPRIARHRRATTISNLQEGFTVVWWTYGGPPNIKGFTTFYDYITNSPNLLIHTTDNTYTDGTSYFDNLIPQIALPNITSDLGGIDIRPVVSYERKSGLVNPNSKQIMCIGFNFTDPVSGHSSCASFYARNLNGKPYCTQTANSPQNEYYRIPTNIIDKCYGIAVSGELSESFLYSWIAPVLVPPSTNIYNKIVQSGANLKSGDMQHTSVNYEILNDQFISVNLSNATKIVSLIDIQGKSVVNAENMQVNNLQELNQGFYLLSYLDASGDANTVKVVKL
ncbi:MAG: hypothetical protein IPO27_10210 [Bacteroidetes bacterium]|nr:hypothetical protein [Bacteroidota bacterium]